ncbi:hypothetical protein pipiens_009448 [Culex pipiens pipiens]|uniref:Uncharacterized protein n=1 Tax=Culex pipiens pipiens TaxID=38569 RepID=A0ABD1DDR9_CULPP
MLVQRLIVTVVVQGPKAPKAAACLCGHRPGTGHATHAATISARSMRWPSRSPSAVAPVLGAVRRPGRPRACPGTGPKAGWFEGAARAHHVPPALPPLNSPGCPRPQPAHRRHTGSICPQEKLRSLRASVPRASLPRNAHIPAHSCCVRHRRPTASPGHVPRPCSRALTQSRAPAHASPRPVEHSVTTGRLFAEELLYRDDERAPPARDTPADSRPPQRQTTKTTVLPPPPPTLRTTPQARTNHNGATAAPTTNAAPTGPATTLPSQTRTPPSYHRIDRHRRRDRLRPKTDSLPKPTSAISL